MYNVVVSTEAADGLAPLGARPSVGTVMIMSRSLIYTGSAIEILGLLAAQQDGHRLAVTTERYM